METGRLKALLIAASTTAVLLLLLASVLAGGVLGSSEGSEESMQAEPKVLVALVQSKTGPESPKRSPRPYL